MTGWQVNHALDTTFCITITDYRTTTGWFSYIDDDQYQVSSSVSGGFSLFNMYPSPLVLLNTNIATLQALQWLTWVSLSMYMDETSHIIEFLHI